MQLVTGYPLWFTIFCLLLSVGYAAALYFRDKKFKDLSRLKIRLLAAFRLIAVFLLAFLLLSPLLKSISKQIEKPVIIFAQDNSESLLFTRDSAFYKKQYQQQLAQFFQSLETQYELNTYTFGEKVEKNRNFTFSEKQTALSELIEEIKNRYLNRNVGALIIASDGIYNKGINPVYSAADTDFPVYTLALGDSSTRKDLILSQVKHNKIAFLGNKFPIQSLIEAKKFKGEKTRLNIFHKGKTVFSQDIDLSSNDFSQSIEAEIVAENKGLQHYTVQIQRLENEASLKNNARDIVIDIIDSKQKILLLSHAPHPDLGAIRRSLELHPNYQIDYDSYEQFNGKIKEYNLVILHQLPGQGNPASTLLKQIATENMPALFILGTQTDVNVLNTLKLPAQVKQAKRSFEEVQGVWNKKFPLFELDKKLADFVQNAPPLIAPFGEYSSNAEANVIFHQQIKNINTGKPLIVLSGSSPFNNAKTGMILGEGIWRWRLHNFRQNTNHDLFDQLINKIVQYLALNVNKENFIVESKRIFNENQPVFIEAQVYNENFEPLGDAIVNIDIFDTAGKQFSFSFTPDAQGGKNYFLNAGVFPVGDYNYTARAEVGEKKYSKKGKFSVVSVDYESVSTVANHKLLYQLAQQNNGKLFFPEQIEQLRQEIDNNDDIVAVSYSSKQLRDVIHLKWLFFLIVGLLSAEWFLRKFYGNY